jgi:hypothetical protein
MSIPSRQELVTRLTDELSYPPYSAQLMADKVQRLQPELQEPFERWWNTGELPAMKVEGYTVVGLMKRRSLNPLAALMTLDWLLREPELARETIERGFDSVETP